jgi:carboxymethylenebutenolidase
MPRDNDQLLDLPSVFGSGVVGVCDICGTRQAVIVLSKERYKLCVFDFLNKTWIKSDKKPGAPLPLYRSESVRFPTDTTKSGTAPGILLAPTKQVKRPAVLITPDIYGVTTTLLDGAIRLAREGFEVMIPDVSKTDGMTPGHHLALRAGVTVRGGIPTSSRRVAGWVDLYADALTFLRGRELVDPKRTALLGISYGGSLAIALAARDTQLSAVALAYPMPVQPERLSGLISAPILYVAGERDRTSARSRRQLEKTRSASDKVPPQFLILPGAGHNFLARDLSAYKMRAAEVGWTRIVAFLKTQLFPPPPTPPPGPPKPAVVAGATAVGKVAAPTSSPAGPRGPPSTPAPVAVPPA